jgi:hypothetical protein
VISEFQSRSSTVATEETQPGTACSTTGARTVCSQRKAVLRLLAFFIVFAIAAAGLDYAISFGMRRIRTSAAGSLNRVMAGKVNAEIVISGSSRALVQYDPRVIQQVTGKTAYNIGRNGSHIDMQLALLKAYLRHNTKPKLVLHNLDLHSFQPTHELYDSAQYLPFLSNPEIYQGISQITPDAWKWRYIPLYGYAAEDMRFTWLTSARAWIGKHPREDYFLGFNPRYLHWTGDFERFKAQNATGFTVAVESRGKQALLELIQLCAAQQIRLVLVYSPEYLDAQELTRNRPEIFRLFQSLAAENGAELWDFSAAELCRRQELFYNSQHLNADGARAFSDALALRLKEYLKARGVVR